MIAQMSELDAHMSRRVKGVKTDISDNYLESGQIAGSGVVKIIYPETTYSDPDKSHISPRFLWESGIMQNKTPAAVAVIVWGGRVLVIKRRIPDGSLVWQFPGGKIEGRESEAQAAVREAWEETGLLVEPVQCLGSRLHPQTGRHIYYVACSVRSVQGKTDAREVEDFGWFSLEELAAHIPDGVWEPVQEYLDGVLASA